MRVLLILVDGMRPDAIENLPRVKKLMEKSTYTMGCTTVMPSVTLPCHISLVHSVEPLRHGTTTNTYAPQVRPVNGLFEVLAQNNKQSALFYSWDELRDVSRVKSITYACYYQGKIFGYDRANDFLTDNAIKYLNENYTDFAFLYLGNTDAVGHKSGWMSEDYMDAINRSFLNIENIIDKLPDDYCVMITSDHGGHDRTHGTELKEDMTIPLIAMGEYFENGKQFNNDVSILDIAPTVAKILNVPRDEEWEGKSLI